jgi:predicted alpha/beta hydrolase family esterase
MQVVVPEWRATVHRCVDQGDAQMKRRLLFVQGGGAGTHDEWDNKLVESLDRELGPGYEIRYPRMPDEDDPSYAAWRPALERELAALADGAILIGHSVGGAVLINVLAEHPLTWQLGAIFLVAAPFVGEGGWPSDDLKTPHNLGARLPRGVPIFVYHGLADESVPPSHAELYARVIPQAQVYRLPRRDHQLDNDLSELAAAIRSLAAGEAGADLES